MSQQLQFKRTSPSAFNLCKASPGSVGFDLQSCTDCIIEAYATAVIPTGLIVKAPEGTYLRIASRSGLAIQGITTQGGVIDPDFRGEIKVIISNANDDPFSVFKGMKIAQLIPEKAAFPQVVEVEVLDETERGEKGFGSSGQ